MFTEAMRGLMCLMRSKKEEMFFGKIESGTDVHFDRVTTGTQLVE